MSTPASRTNPWRTLLGPRGPVAVALDARGVGRFEDRPEQQAMADAVASALSSGRHLVVEAGTGVGKSFAYLVPLLAWAAEREATVAVATSTIALQEQLVRQDLPLLARTLPFEVTYALVKGRGNYLCLRRMHRAFAEGTDLFDASEASSQLQAIRRWSTTTPEGSLQDLPFRPAPDVWDLVRAEQGNCKGRACPYYAPCPYQRARRTAREVRCLVLNHHVLMADLALRQSGATFLPDVAAVVVDEAHDLEDTAAEHLGARLGSVGSAMLLGRLWNPRRGRGLLASGGDERLRDRVERTRTTAGRFFGELGEWVRAGTGGGGIRPLEGEFPVADPLEHRLLELADDLGRATSGLADEDAALELEARRRQVLGAAETLRGLVAGREGEVRWAETTRRGAVTLASAPVDVGPLLETVLWDAHESVVLTSATLATGRPPSFRFLRERLGLEDADELAVGSPFDYLRQARIRVRRDLPDPVSDPGGYAAGLPDAVWEAVERTRGGAFVLFTGYQSMRQVVEALRPRLESNGHEVLVQGEGLERAALLERFRGGGAVLFGVASFWQGVDVPGDALRHVVIARLPFEVPTHPLQRARQDRLKAAGRDPFRELSLPVAALRLKQGFGRLIRAATDEGLVTILDPRILTRRYGRDLLASLPECPLEEIA